MSVDFPSSKQKLLPSRPLSEGRQNNQNPNFSSRGYLIGELVDENEHMDDINNIPGVAGADEE